MKEIAEFIIKKIESLECGDDCPSFSNNELIPVNISQENYHEIKPRKDEQIICFVDGGNSELISANNISLQFIRMAAVFYKGQQKLFRKNKEFYCLTYFEDNFFKTKIFPKDAFLEPTFNSFDETLMSGRTRVKITKIAQAIRRLAELSFAEEQAKNSSCNFLVLDGSLEERFTYENEYLKKLFETCKKQNILLSGVSKTNSILTQKGDSLTKKLLSRKEGCWFYFPVAKNDFEVLKINISFAKLHEKSKYIFRIDVSEQNKTKDVCEILLNMAKDPVFIGYPYGLIETDGVARVSNREKEYLKTKLMVYFKRDQQKIKDCISSQDAHDILDNIS